MIALLLVVPASNAITYFFAILKNPPLNLKYGSRYNPPIYRLIKGEVNFLTWPIFSASNYMIPESKCCPSNMVPTITGAIPIMTISPWSGSTYKNPLLGTVAKLISPGAADRWFPLQHWHLEHIQVY